MASFAADIKTSGDHAPDKMHVNSKGETNQGSVSDNDGSDSEKPMRKKLEETTITQELNGDDHEDSASDDDGIDTKEQKGGHNKGSAVLKSDEHNATVEMDDEHGAVGDDVEPKTVSHDREWAKYGDMDADDEKTPHAKTRSRTRRSQGNEDVDQDSSADGVESKPGRYRGKRSRHGDIDTTETMAIDAAEDKSTESEERRMGTPDGDGTTRLGNVTSPRGKRNRAQYLQDEQDASPEPAVRTTSALAAKFMERVSSESRSTDDERVPKRHRSTSPKRKISEKGAEPTKEESTKVLFSFLIVDLANRAFSSQLLVALQTYPPRLHLPLWRAISPLPLKPKPQRLHSKRPHLANSLSPPLLGLEPLEHRLAQLAHSAAWHPVPNSLLYRVRRILDQPLADCRREPTLGLACSPGRETRWDSEV